MRDEKIKNISIDDFDFMEMFTLAIELAEAEERRRVEIESKGKVLFKDYLFPVLADAEKSGYLDSEVATYAAMAFLSFVLLTKEGDRLAAAKELESLSSQYTKHWRARK